MAVEIIILQDITPSFMIIQNSHAVMPTERHLQCPPTCGKYRARGLKVIPPLCKMNEITWCPLIKWQQLNPSSHERVKDYYQPGAHQSYLNKGRADAARVVPGGDHSIVLCKY
jgi:hypothetical protein